MSTCHAISSFFGGASAAGLSRRLFAAVGAVTSVFAAQPAHADPVFDTLDKIRKTGVVTIGHRQSELPFSYVANGRPTGYSIELCERIVQGLSQKLGLPKIDIQFVPATAATRFVLMRSGKIDMECAATTNNAERRKMVEFSLPHFVTATRFVSLTSSHIDKIADLAGKSVASTTGTINIEQLNTINRSRGLNISVLINKEHKDAFAMVESGKASAFVMDDILLAGLVAASANPSDFTISSEALSRPEPYGILLPAGDLAFKSAVNEILTRIYVSGEINDIYNRWFMSPVPPSGLNMKLPMSPELKSGFADPKEYKD
jgi:glutamate/aspartate transport system substrate-binding protein